MKDRGMIKWRPFNAVISGKELLKDYKVLPKPNLSSDEGESLEETIKSSLYTKSPVIITYLKNNKKIKEEKIVSKVDPINKNIFFTDRTKINFRQIYKAIQK